MTEWEPYPELKPHDFELPHKEGVLPITAERERWLQHYWWFVLWNLWFRIPIREEHP